MEEIWRDIPNYNGYQVSNKGRVRTHNKVTFTKKHGERHWKDRILRYKGESYSPGYRVDLWKDGKPHTKLVARLVAFTFFDKDIKDHTLTVNHIDGNRFNNNIENLELISLGDNIRHAFDNGLIPCKKVILTNKKNNRSAVYRSMSAASQVMHYNAGYISLQTKRGKNENDDFIWEVV